MIDLFLLLITIVCVNLFTLVACASDIAKHEFEHTHCNLYCSSDFITITTTDMEPTSLLLCGNKVLIHVIILVQTGLVFQLISDVQHSHSTGSQHCPQHSHSIMSSTGKIFIKTEKYHETDGCVYSCDQAALQMVFSVRLSVCPSVRPSVTPFWLCSHHRIIMKFSGVITNDESKVHAKGQGQRSEVKVTEVTTQLDRFRTVTPVWIHIWWWNDAYSLMLLRRGALLFFEVIRQISRSHGSKNRLIWPRLGVSGL